MDPWILKGYCEQLKNETDYFQREVSNRLSGSETILDAGCGSGEFGVLKKCGKPHHATIVGMDISMDSMEQNEILDQRIVGDLENIPLPDGSVDLVVCESVLEHLEKPQAVFSEFSRVLNSGGYLVLRTFNIWNWANAISAVLPVGVRSRLKGKLVEADSEGTFETYYRCNSRKKLRKLCGDVGLIEDNFITHGAWPGYWGHPGLVSLFALYEKMTDNRLLGFTKVLIVGVYEKRV